VGDHVGSLSINPGKKKNARKGYLQAVADRGVHCHSIPTREKCPRCHRRQPVVRWVL